MTKFQKFLDDCDACPRAQKFVAKHRGNFRKAWRNCPHLGWKAWLYVVMGVSYYESTPYVWHKFRSTRARNTEVFRKAKALGWIR
jgi:hypothetical protein